MKKRKKEKRSERVGDENYKEKHNERQGRTHNILVFSIYRIFIRRDYSRNISRGGLNSKVEWMSEWEKEREKKKNKRRRREPLLIIEYAIPLHLYVE